MLTTSKNILFPGHNHLLTTSTDDPTLSLSPEHQRMKERVFSTCGYQVVMTWKYDFLEVASMVVTARVIIKELDHQSRRLVGGYDLDIGHF